MATTVSSRTSTPDDGGSASPASPVPDLAAASASWGEQTLDMSEDAEEPSFEEQECEDADKSAVEEGKDTAGKDSPEEQEAAKEEESDMGDGNDANAKTSKEEPDGTGDAAAARTFHKSSSFIRVADLKIDNLSLHEHHTRSTDSSDVPHPEPPPADVCPDPNHWMALDHVAETPKPSVYAPLIVRGLVRAGLDIVFHPAMWTSANKATTALLRQQQDRLSRGLPVDDVQPGTGTHTHKDGILLYTGKITHHSHHGHDIPLVKSRGIVGMKPRDLCELLVDSARVGSYNKNSLGRTDELVLSNELDSDEGGGVTKVVKSRAKPPLIRKTLEFVSLLHARKLQPEDEAGGTGYVLVSRAVTRTDEAGLEEEAKGGVIRSEVLLNVHLIRNLVGVEDKCEMINVNHLRSPMVPTFVAKKIGMNAAVSFMHDIRALC